MLPLLSSPVRIPSTPVIKQGADVEQPVAVAGIEPVRFKHGCRPKQTCPLKDVALTVHVTVALPTPLTTDSGLPLLSSWSMSASSLPAALRTGHGYVAESSFRISPDVGALLLPDPQPKRQAKPRAGKARFMLSPYQLVAVFARS